MKIYIETNMTEMPKGCTWCKRKVCIAEQYGKED